LLHIYVTHPSPSMRKSSRGTSSQNYSIASHLHDTSKSFNEEVITRDIQPELLHCFTSTWHIQVLQWGSHDVTMHFFCITFVVNFAGTVWSFATASQMTIRFDQSPVAAILETFGVSEIFLWVKQKWKFLSLFYENENYYSEEKLNVIKTRRAVDGAHVPPTKLFWQVTE